MSSAARHETGSLRFFTDHTLRATKKPTPKSGPAPRPQASTPAARDALGALHHRLLLLEAPASVIVDADAEILHLSRGMSRYLQQEGTPSTNLLHAVHPDLRLPLRSLVYQATQEGTRVERQQLRVGVDDAIRLVDLLVAPIQDAAVPAGALLVLVRDVGAAGADGADAAPADGAAARALEAELAQTRQQLQLTVEEYESQGEEYKAANEELQAINEELRASGEELETSREELQAVNEELSTVNTELKHRVDEVTHANNDLQNLIAATAIATLFVDRELRLTRYTPSAEQLFNLIPTDLHRPLAHITHTLHDTQLVTDAQQVLRTLAPIEREVASTDGRWYLLGLRPYRTTDDRIAGVVITLVDITARRAAETAVRSSEERLRLLIESATDYAIFTLDVERQVTGWNSGAERIFGYSEADIVGQSADVVFTPEDRDQGAPAREMERARTDGRAADERWHLRADGTRFYGSGVVTPLRDADGTLHGYVKILRDLTEQQRAAEALRASEAKYRTLFDSMDEGYAVVEVLATDTGTWNDFRFLDVNPAFINHTGMEYPVGRTATELLGTPNPQWAQIYGRVVDTGEPVRFEESEATLGRVFDLYCFPLNGGGSRRVAVLFTDITERKAAEAEREQLLRAAEAARAAADLERRRLLAVLEQLPVGVHVAEAPSGRLLLDNAAVRAICGAAPLSSGVADYSRDYAGHYPAGHARAGEPLANHDWPLARALTTGAPVAEELVEIRRADGTRRIASISAVAVRDADGRVVGAVATSVDVTDMQRAEAAVRQSEAKYRTLFETIDEGFAVYDLTRDASGTVVDMVYRETNTAFERLTGLTNVVGRWASELVPNLEPSWLARNQRVADTGIAERAEDYIGDLDRWFSVHHSRVGGAGSTVVAAVFDDITERKRREANQDLLVDLSADLSRLSTEAEIIHTVGAKLAAHLGLTCYHYVDVNEDRADVTLRHFWHALDVPAILGTYPIDGFIPPYGLHRLRAGEPSIINDVQTDLSDDTATTAALKAGAAAQQIAAYVAVPYSQDGQWKAYFAVADSRPRHWTRLDIEVLQEVASRMFPRIERARAEAALRDSEARLRGLLENLPAGAAFIVDRELRYVLAEGEALHAAGMQAADLVGKTIFEVLDAELAAGYAPLYRHALHGEPFAHEHAAHAHTYLTRGTPLRAANGEVYAVLAVSYDITERKHAERALRESETRFRTVTDAVPQVIWANDASGTAIYFNQRWFDYSGLSEEQSVGPGWQAIVHPDDAPASVDRWQRALAAGTTFDTEYRLRRADGVYRWHLGRNVPLHDSDGHISGWFGSATDIHDERLAREAALETHAEAEAALRTREQFLSIASHELRIPLTSLIGYAYLLPRAATQGPDAITSLGERITHQARRLDTLVGQLLDVSRLQQGAFVLDRQALDLAALVGQVVDAFRVALPADNAHGITVERPDAPVVVDADGPRLEQVLLNLLTNAAKYSPPGSPIMVTLAVADDQAIITVADHGIGIPHDAQAQLFTPFYRASNVPAQSSGFGIGLYVVQQIVERHRGTIAVDSTDGQGTTVRVVLPLADGST